MTETYARWEPVAGITSPCLEAILHADPADVTVSLTFSVMEGHRDMRVRFGWDVIACMSHAEFAHPWQAYTDVGEVPRLAEKWARYAYPLLLVSGSHWLASFRENELIDYDYAAIRHFRFYSLGNTVDVLTVGDPSAEWVEPVP